MALDLDELRNFINIKRIVIKVGSSTLSYPNGRLNITQMERLVRELADLQNRGMEVILVSSGAQGAGIGKMGMSRRPKTIPEKQAAAAIGQGLLMHMYEKLFSEYGITVAQVLLTREDIMDRKRFLNARNALNALLGMETIPIINENDTIAVEEIRFGDNDALSALVASLIEAELLIILSDIAGLYTGNPSTDKDATLIPLVTEINEDIEHTAGGSGSRLGTGGMVTKLQAAKVAMNSGFPMIIASGSEKRIVRRIIAGEQLGTLFLPRENRLHSKKRWIAFGSNVQGIIIIDSGARKALTEEGKSLLPSGIVSVEGAFEIGNTVSVFHEDKEIGRGIVNYSSLEIDIIRGKKTREIAKILGYKDFDEVIHRDNFALNI
ncbi:glutamate 5-kinase [Phosphitispora fastidiosa]|uniref:glutamate 5-kinase n=1 Tax=Phosphitispora fastidiosa TaxID=2837202 RepID=UPI001E46C2F1|nr:glutamate 5-kinase [Phosphitispora fastidiosa]MBU7005941.1 glutamate 5-kinase [Phosphitispora fastidiosa]